MRKVTNTTEKVLNHPGEALLAVLGGSAGIEAQEARGQQELVHSDVLPTEGLSQLRQMIEEAGGAIGEPVNGDPMFTQVTLPAGWEKRSTDHSMWSKLVDDKGRERASMFYKAAFYDRAAFIRGVTRFSVSVGPGDGYPDKDCSEVYGVAKDQVDGDVFLAGARKIDEIATRYSQIQSAAKDAEDWLDSNYPDWRNSAAYW